MDFCTIKCHAVSGISYTHTHSRHAKKMNINFHFPIHNQHIPVYVSGADIFSVDAKYTSSDLILCCFVFNLEVNQHRASSSKTINADKMSPWNLIYISSQAIFKYSQNCIILCLVVIHKQGSIERQTKCIKHPSFVQC